MIVGIGGVSRAGKTTLANLLKNRLKGKSIYIVNQDDFVKKENLPMIKSHVDWEHPHSIDWNLMKKEILRLKSKYDVLIVEGLFAFYDRSISKKFDIAIFIHIDHKSFIKRKHQDFRWGKEPAWFIQHIWASYVRYGKIIEDIPIVLYLNGTTPTPLEQIIRLLVK